MQQMEMDMVQGMYDSYTLCSEDPPTYSVVLAATEDGPQELRVTIVYDTEEYPESAVPTVQLEYIGKHRRMSTATLSKEIAELCEAQIGMHSVISVLQRVQEYLTEYAEMEEKAELARRGQALMSAAAATTTVVHDPTIRMGTAVTRELFEEWNRKRREQKLRESGGVNKTNDKLTGRQLWDAALKSTEWELFESPDGGEQDDGLDVFDCPGAEDEEYDLDDPDE
ncbi:hypothetical protein TRVL_06974 [Trypanosoma vivax]|nr:hypothetical protein TRVL_06974 [Trypanosoma vivax]